MDLNFLMNTEPWQWPENAGEICLQVLRDSQASESDRLMAAELVGDPVAVNDAVVETLLFIATSDNEPEKLRGQALISLGPVLELAEWEGFEDPDEMPITQDTFLKMQATLAQLFHDERVAKDVRRSALEASIRFGSDWHEQAVKKAYADGDEDWKLTAVFCMQYLPGFKKQILESLHSDNPLIHEHAVHAAGNWEFSEAWNHIADLASSSDIDKELRLAAIQALGTIEPEKSEMILHDLTSDHEQEVVDAAYESLGMVDGSLSSFDDDLDDEDLD